MLDTQAIVQSLHKITDSLSCEQELKDVDRDMSYMVGIQGTKIEDVITGSGMECSSLCDDDFEATCVTGRPSVLPRATIYLHSCFKFRSFERNQRDESWCEAYTAFQNNGVVENLQMNGYRPGNDSSVRLYSRCSLHYPRSRRYRGRIHCSTVTYSAENGNQLPRYFGSQRRIYNHVIETFNMT
ncbi:uncharacterized protein RCO7_15170 [Rhynchosporium graminicola]|uniref:Uncharacterized protein n=1 Tax=Rhynchosporium graminicola TaxID=2792576 RepID=A0A1E1LNU7_9HELO|nr:uncharacterized protein RCO7_15170 [Rhynchosporium commune]